MCLIFNRSKPQCRGTRRKPDQHADSYGDSAAWNRTARQRPWERLMERRGESDRGRTPALSVRPMPFDDVAGGVLADSEVASEPTETSSPFDGMEHLRGEPV